MPLLHLIIVLVVVGLVLWVINSYMPITEMSPRIEQLKNECRTEWTSQGKIIDNGFVANPGKYVLRPRISWTGLYGKEPWPRERKQWEKI